MLIEVTGIQDGFVYCGISMPLYSKQLQAHVLY